MQSDNDKLKELRANIFTVCRAIVINAYGQLEEDEEKELRRVMDIYGFHISEDCFYDILNKERIMELEKQIEEMSKELIELKENL